MTKYTLRAVACSSPSLHLSKKSQPACDHKLQEQSHMKSDGVHAWLHHWLKLQKKGRHPLVVKNPADKSSEARQKPTTLSKRKAKQAKARDIYSDDAGEQDMADKSDDGGTDAGSDKPPARRMGQATEQPDDDKVLPPAPSTASATRKTRRTFLATLSNDTNYKKLQQLLYAAQVSKQILH